MMIQFQETRVFEGGDIRIQFKAAAAHDRSEYWSVTLSVGGAAAWTGYATEATHDAAASLLSERESDIQAWRERGTPKRMRLVNVSSKIDAIKVIRDRTGLGLREAKAYVDKAMSDGVDLSAPEAERLNTGMKECLTRCICAHCAGSHLTAQNSAGWGWYWHECESGAVHHHHCEWGPLRRTGLHVLSE